MANLLLGHQPPSNKELESILHKRVTKQTKSAEFSESYAKFVPHDCIDGLLPDGMVSSFLRSSCSRTERKELVRYVFDAKKPAKIIFMTCVMSGLKDKYLKDFLGRFKQANFQDRHLPVTDKNLHLVPFLDEKESSFIGASAELFQTQQWRFLAPVFGADAIKMDIPVQIPLPFTHSQKNVGIGGYGTVHKVTVHPEHMKHEAAKKNNEGTGYDVALKEMNQSTGEFEEGSFEREFLAHWNTRSLRGKHIVKLISAIRRGPGKNYLMFVWANGQDLGKYWREVRRPVLSAGFVRTVVEQCRGLIEGLSELHNMDDGHYRHTDIKPANILRSIDDPVRDKAEIGLLQISDMGLAKHHFVATDQRHGTDARAATTRYCPPEAAFDIAEGGMGRRYDIWSMGCVMFELVIWLLHGTRTLDSFNNDWLSTPKGNSTTQYFERLGMGQVIVHPVVASTMERLLDDPECQGETAIGDLLRLVKDKMLVVNLGADSREGDSRTHLTVTGSTAFSPSGAARATSTELLQLFDRILDHERGSAYWFTGRGRETVPPLRDPRQNGGLMANHSHGHTQSAQLNNRWEYSTDNDFAAEALQNHQDHEDYFSQTGKGRLCGKCAGFTLTKPFFSFTDTWEELERCRVDCDFCSLRWKACKDLAQAKAPVLRFEREGSLLKLNGSYPPVLAICRSLKENEKVQEQQNGSDDHHIQIGFPRLPPASSPTSFRILKQWLRDCDENHPQCRVHQSHTLPTRLLDVGTAASPVVRVYKTRPGDAMQYAALSHLWGQGPHFCTLPSNIDEFRRDIRFGALPETFQHAVVVTRELGLRYIWIDSLCIVQGPDGDFEQEAGNMEGVFSAAYCVFAGCYSRGQNDGFLKRRVHDRDFVTVERRGLAPLYVCRFIDDFGKDVLDSKLSHRGWVLQEHALARRTVFFTEAQMYWECGDGVRCQSLTKMNNKLASFLGDPNFPSKISGDNSLRGEKILFYENMYRQYSRLQFTRATDRAVAIAGLQQRLLHDLRAHGGLGVFDDGRSLLQHSLLWQRGKEYEALTRIDFGGDNDRLPSWSWMAYNEGIDFLDLPLGDIRWLPDEIVSPWADIQHRPPAATSSKWRTEEFRGPPEMSIRVRSFRADAGLSAAQTAGRYGIIYDAPDPTRTGDGSVLCVLMGKAKDHGKPDRQLVHYVLFVAPRGQRKRDSSQAYERVGVGFLLGKYIDLDSPGALVKLR